MNLGVLEDGSRAWKDGRGVYLYCTDPIQYSEALPALVRHLCSVAPRGVIITANRPVEILLRSLQEANVNCKDLYFIDCVTGMTGVLPPSQEGVMFIESPSMLEKIALRAEQLLRRMEAPRFLLVDSLSTLTVYNGHEAVAELAHGMATRLRLQGVAVAFLLMEAGSASPLLESLAATSDGTIRA